MGDKIDQVSNDIQDERSSGRFDNLQSTLIDLKENDLFHALREPAIQESKLGRMVGQVTLHDSSGKAADKPSTGDTDNHKENTQERERPSSRAIRPDDRSQPQSSLAPQESRQLAERAFDAMNKDYVNYPHHEWAPYVPGFTTAWPLGQQIQAALAADKLGEPNLNTANELGQRLDALHYYWDNKDGIGGYDAGVNGIFNNHDRYYDDNAWIGLDLMDVYKRDGKQDWALDQAKKIFELEQHGADEASRVANAPGGVMWQEGDKNGFRGTVSTAGATQLALRLYETTHEQKYLDFAKKQFDWEEQHLSDGQGEFSDGIEGNGNKHTEIYSYNQGLMLGDAAMLYQATGDAQYKDKARETIDASTRHFSEAELEKQQPIFNAIYFKNLMEADALLQAPPEVQQEHREMIQQYADYLRRHMDKNGLVVTGIEQDGTWKSLTQSAAVQIFSMLS